MFINFNDCNCDTAGRTHTHAFLFTHKSALYWICICMHVYVYVHPYNCERMKYLRLHVDLCPLILPLSPHNEIFHLCTPHWVVKHAKIYGRCKYVGLRCLWLLRFCAILPIFVRKCRKAHLWVSVKETAAEAKAERQQGCLSMLLQLWNLSRICMCVLSAWVPVNL